MHESLVIRTRDIPTLFITGQPHLHAFMSHVDGHLVMFYVGIPTFHVQIEKFGPFFVFFLTSTFLF